jgi:hypothetical protein
MKPTRLFNMVLKKGGVKMKKVMMVLVTFFMFSVVAIPFVNAANFVCPAPNQINCVPAKTTIQMKEGVWKHNDGQMTGNTFENNKRCANVISLPNNQSRLICCYTKCGVFLLDVPFAKCIKQSPSLFLCR